MTSTMLTQRMPTETRGCPGRVIQSNYENLRRYKKFTPGFHILETSAGARPRQAMTDNNEWSNNLKSKHSESRDFNID